MKAFQRSVVVICVLNCCKYSSGLSRLAKGRAEQLEHENETSYDKVGYSTRVHNAEITRRQWIASEEFAAGDVFSWTSKEQLLVCSSFWIALWVSLFYMLAGVSWDERLGQSKKPHENRYWVARTVLGIAHAKLVTLLALPAFIKFLSASQDTRFGTCDPMGEPYGMDLHAWNMEYRQVAMAGLVFTTFTAVDMVLSWVHGLATIDYVIHHMAFVAAGLIIRLNCMLLFNASILLSTEASTVFLNIALLFRNRGPQYKCRVLFSGLAFMVTYFVLRIGVGTYGTVLLWQAYVNGYSWPEHYIPVWQQACVLGGLTVGSAIQFYWLPPILHAFLRSAIGGKQEEEATDGDDEADKVPETVSQKLDNAGPVEAHEIADSTSTGAGLTLEPSAPT